MSNPVWRHYVSEMIADWLTWCRNVHLPSHIDVMGRFIALNPGYIPVRSTSNPDIALVKNMLWDEDFILGLSEKAPMETSLRKLTPFATSLILTCLGLKECMLSVGQT